MSPAAPEEEERPIIVRIPRKKRYSKYRTLPPSPAFSAPTDFKKQHGVTLGRAPRPCLLPGPQPYTYPRNINQLPSEPGPGEYNPRAIVGDREHEDVGPDGFVPLPGKQALELRLRTLRKRITEFGGIEDQNGGARHPGQKAVLRIEAANSLRRYRREYAETRLLMRHLAAIEADERHEGELPSPETATLKSTASTLYTTTTMAASRAISRQGSFPLTVTAQRFDWMS